jgi:metacaspase-1
MRDDDHGEEDDGNDEALCPLDYDTAGMLRDDDLYEILVKPLPNGVRMVSLVSDF